MKTKLLLIIAIVFSFSACKKDDIPEKENPVNEDLQAYFGFKYGSYWIYKDAISGTIDSVSIAKIVTVTNKQKQGDSLSVQKSYYYFLNHSANHLQTKYVLYNSFPFVDYQTEFSLSNISLIRAPFGNSVMVTEMGEIITIPAEQPITVNNITFNKGIEMPWLTVINTQNGTTPDNKYTYFKFDFVRDVGIVRRELKNNNLHQKWELIDYKIVR